jgi:hypothetical protein
MNLNALSGIFVTLVKPKKILSTTTKELNASNSSTAYSSLKLFSPIWRNSIAVNAEAFNARLEIRLRFTAPIISIFLKEISAKTLKINFG